MSEMQLFNFNTKQLLTQFYDKDGYPRDQFSIHGLSQMVHNLAVIVDALVTELMLKGDID